MVRGKDVASLPSIALRMVVLRIPKEKKVKSLSEEDLKKMGCHLILERP